MSYITIKIQTDNAAFEDDKPAEIERIIDTIDFHRDYQPLRDINGNTVGEYNAYSD